MDIIYMSEDSFEERVIKECTDKQNIFIYVSKEDEINTFSVIRKLLSIGKTIVVPVVKGNEIELSVLRDLDNLTKGEYGILEPTEKIRFQKEDIDIFFVPGTKFDNVGNRKGRGKGYFDRFLKDVKGKKPIIGICHKNQVVDKLNTNPWDVSVDRLIEK